VSRAKWTKWIGVHAAALAVAAVWAYATWTRPEVGAVDRSRSLVWERDTVEVLSVHYVSPEKDVRVERRTDQAGAFLWGVETDASIDGRMEYPVGAAGETLVARFASLRVIRDLGRVSAGEREQYGLADAREQIELGFRNETRKLMLGDSVYGSDARYVLDSSTEAGYVLPGELMRPLRTGEGALRERWIHEFRAPDAARIRVISEGRERVMVRTEEGDWTAPGAQEPDAGFANFVQRLEQLAIGGYEDVPAAGDLSPLLRIDYFDGDDDVMGFLELFRHDAAQRNPYYLRSERTRVLARALTALAERVDEGIADLF